MILDKNLSFIEKYYLIREELLQIVKEANNAQTIVSKITHNSITINDKLYRIKDIIRHLTIFLNKYNCTLSERFYYIYHDIHEVVMCKECRINKPNFQNWTLGYREFCSTRCSTLNKNTQEKKRQTCFEHYGVEHQMDSLKIKNKIKQTNLERYGVEYATQNPDIRDKVIKTNIERYGVEYPTQNDDILKKLKQTNLNKYGCEFTLQSPKIQKKIYNTNSKKYGVKHPTQNININNKIKQTNLERYGVENVSQNKDVKKKKEVTCLKNFGHSTHLKHPKIKKNIQETNLERYGTICSLQNEEIKNKSKQTNLERYGFGYPSKSEEIKEKVKQTNLERYGVEYSYQSNEVKEKIKRINLKRYGVENVSQSKEIRKKIEKTNLKKYGTICSLQNEEIKNKSKQTNLERYGFEYPSQSEEIKEKSIINRNINFFENVLIQKEFLNEFEMLFTFKEYKGTAKQKYKFKHISCGYVFEAWIKDGLIPKCPKCSPPNNQSQHEIEIRKFLTEYTDNIITNSKSIIRPYELDIYLPDYNLAIEFNGLYWHSETQGKDQNYHIEKSKKCWERKINLIHIFEDEWNNKNQILQSMILERINKSPWEVNGENCRIKKVSDIDRDKFLEKHHIQGKVQSSCRQLYNYGLFKNDYLVSLLVLGKPRFDEDHEYEIYRFCNYIGTSISNGFNILFNYAMNDLNSNNVIVYTDLRFDTGRFYKDHEFKYIGHIEPIYYYVQVGGNHPKRINHNNIDNCSSLNYDIIWDCGCAIYEKSN